MAGMTRDQMEEAIIRTQEDVKALDPAQFVGLRREIQDLSEAVKTLRIEFESLRRSYREHKNYAHPDMNS